MNYAIEMDKTLQSIGSVSPRVLLQACCAPCSTVVLEQLSQRLDLSLLYYNPNTMPGEEYTKRLAAFSRLRPHYEFRLIEGNWENAEFLERVKGMEALPEGGARCAVCIRMRLEETARRAKAEGYDFFGTTLTVGPRKNPELINGIGYALAEAYGVNWFPADFKKRNGFKRSVELSNEFGLYRQAYCGCRL